MTDIWNMKQTKNFNFDVVKQSPKLRHGVAENGNIVANCGSHQSQQCDILSKSPEIMGFNYPHGDDEINVFCIGDSTTGFGIPDQSWALFRKIVNDSYDIDSFYEIISDKNGNKVLSSGDIILMRHDNGVPFVRMIDSIIDNNNKIEIKTISSKTKNKENRDSHHYSIDNIIAKFIKVIA